MTWIPHFHLLVVPSFILLLQTADESIIQCNKSSIIKTSLYLMPHHMPGIRYNSGYLTLSPWLPSFQGVVESCLQTPYAVVSIGNVSQALTWWSLGFSWWYISSGDGNCRRLWPRRRSLRECPLSLDLVPGPLPFVSFWPGGKKKLLICTFALHCTVLSSKPNDPFLEKSSLRLRMF